MIFKPTLTSNRRGRLMAAAVALLCASLPFQNFAAPKGRPVPADPTAAFVPGELLIEFNENASDQELAEVFAAAGLKVKRQIHTPEMKKQAERPIHLADSFLTSLTAIDVLAAHPAIARVQPNWIYRHTATANDPFYTGGNLWGMYSPDTPIVAGPAGTTSAYGSQAEQAWAQGFVGSAQIYVGIIDEGLDFNHPDLSQNVWTNPSEIPGNNVDDDGNGYVDDVHGWNAFDGNGNVYDAASDDHGTHVAGTIGASGNNGFGVAGVNWNVKMVSGKFLGPNGGTTLDAIEAIDYMVHLKTAQGLNIVALNNSWGGGGYDPALLSAIVRAANANILFVAAAGNGNTLGVGINNDSSPQYPASYNTSSQAGYDSVIAVAAIDSTGAKAPWSNYGATSVDLGAPGVGIYSTLPGNNYGSYSGTSMATPHVTGAAALYASTHPTANAAQIRSALLGSTAPTASLAGKTVTGGRLDLSSVISAAYVPPPSPATPAAPTGLQAVGGFRRITLTWTDNSSDETGFKIDRSTDGTNFSEIGSVGANVTSVANTGVQKNRTYYYRVRSYNNAGSSAPSNVATARSQ